MNSISYITTNLRTSKTMAAMAAAIPTVSYADAFANIDDSIAFYYKTVKPAGEKNFKLGVSHYLGLLMLYLESNSLDKVVQFLDCVEKSPLIDLRNPGSPGVLYNYGLVLKRINGTGELFARVWPTLLNKNIQTLVEAEEKDLMTHLSSINFRTLMYTRNMRNGTLQVIERRIIRFMIDEPMYIDLIRKLTRNLDTRGDLFNCAVNCAYYKEKSALLYKNNNDVRVVKQGLAHIPEICAALRREHAEFRVNMEHAEGNVELARVCRDYIDALVNAFLIANE